MDNERQWFWVCFPDPKRPRIANHHIYTQLGHMGSSEAQFPHVQSVENKNVFLLWGIYGAT